MELQVQEKDNNKVVFENDLYHVIVTDVHDPVLGATAPGYGALNIKTGVVEHRTHQIAEALTYAVSSASFVEEDVHKRYAQSRVQTMDNTSH